MKLNSVTLVGIDCHNPVSTIRSMRASMRHIDFSECVIATDMDRFPDEVAMCGRVGIRVFHIVETDRKEMVAGRLLPIDYEWDVLKVTKDLFSSEFCLFQEWDAGVINGAGWSDYFLGYDYIGAPWYFRGTIQEPGWPPIDANNCVGNGGFSLKSKRWCESIAKIADEDAGTYAIKSSDRWQCRTAKDRIEALGIRYAPSDLAYRFSCEDRIYGGQFGYHGKYTIKANGWNLDLLPV